MKKNKTMRIASVLLIAVLLTTCIISGTFAKYVTSGEVEDQARVAKFGVVVNGSGSLFAENYWAVDQDESNKPGDAETDHTTEYLKMTVESLNGDKLVAPGTKNADGGMTIGITGKPEVDVRITVDTEGFKDVFLGIKTELPDMTTSVEGATFDNFVEYHPIVFTLRGAFVEANKAALQEAGLTSYKNYVTGSLEEIVKAFDILFDMDNEGLYVDANTDLTEAIGTLTLTWKWDYETELTNAEKTAIGDAAVSYWNTEKEAESDAFKAIKAEYGSADKYSKAMVSAAAELYHDRQDTLLGDLAAAKYGDFDADETLFGELIDGTDYNLEVSLKLAITVTQVD